MAEIIPLDEARRSSRSGVDAGTRGIGPAKVLLFTGVHYEKRDTHPKKAARKSKSNTETALKS
ncbi:hypothetical protein [Agrobacterium sp. NPDC090273]|uniref:hypothetical protein n=1 Tax=Agrobacterium TaxID=357 RepID=UPI0021CFB381|nr:hypothetical protein [Agrobacterium tumefaciens]UXS00565.1 hypothetical protein FY156_03195 [Agrobacterium tumefaciens]